MGSREPGPPDGLVHRPRALARVCAPSPLAERIAGDLRSPEGELATRAEDDLAALEAPITVVWCEDDGALQEIIRSMWGLCTGSYGWMPHPDDALLFTPCGDEALALVRAHRPALLVTDEHHAGGLGGWRLLEELALDPSIALGYVTAPCCMPSDTGGLDTDELDLCLLKPFDLGALLGSLAPIVRRLRAGTYTPPPERATRIHQASQLP